MTIVEFLLARIAEDEATARAAWDMRVPQWIPASEADGHWHAHTYPHEGTQLVEGSEAACTDDMTVEYHDHDAEWEHVARFDPARVLDECAAKRRIVAIYPARERWVEDRMICELEPRMARAGWDVPPVLYALAAVYSDHPDFDEAWRVA